MRLYTNENNSVALKVLISSEITGNKVSLEYVSVNDKRFQSPRRLPVLELDCGVRLFSSNSACIYIYPPDAANTQTIDNWLNWEATKLQPALVLFTSKPEYASLINELLIELDSALSSSSHLVGDIFSQADICIWVTLYPLFTDEKLRKQFLDKRGHILKWYQQLSEIGHFKSGEKLLNGKKGLVALESVASACWYPPPAESSQGAAQQQVPSSPSHEGRSNTVSEEEINLAVAAWERGSSSRVEIKSSQKPVLPKTGEKNILVTSALPYVNNVPHLGNIIGCVLSADVFARYCRARNWNTLFVCGTDEYGTATETKALEEGLTPKAICDKYFAIHDRIYSWFNISFDHFGRTTAAAQKEVVQEIFTQCHQNGFTSTAEMDQLFCEKCERFLADRFVEGTCPDCKYEDARGDQCDSCGHLMNTIDLIQPRCKLCQTTPVVKQSQQLFLELPKIEGWLKDWVDETSEGWTPNARVITKSWLNRGLKARCITRDLKWGVPVPLQGFDQKVFYVWFDAPIGYISMTKAYTKNWDLWWKKNPKFNIKYYQFMAKDNVPFHSIMFPASLHAANADYNMVDHLIATEYLNYEDGKFSKSRGVGVFGNDAEDTGIESEIYRFYLLYIRPESQDSNFSWSDMALKINTELLNNLGNFVNRALVFADKFYFGFIPSIELTLEEKKLLGLISMELKGYISALDKAKLREGIKYILNISRHGNLYIQSNTPWVLVKGSDDEKYRAATVVGMACNMVALIASLLQPYMPATVSKIASQINLKLERLSIQEEFMPFFEPDHKIGKPYPLFYKIEPAFADSLKTRFSGRQKSETPEKSTSAKTNSKKVDKTPTFPSKAQYETAVSALEDAVTTQGELVRKMKSEGKKKEELQPMISTLLDLKKQLNDLKACYQSELRNGEAETNTKSSSADVSQLEEKIAAQGEKVRQLKSSGADKSVWQPEVNILLDLKKKLAEAQGVPPQAQPSSGKKKKNKK